MGSMETNKGYRMKNLQELVIELHDIARETKDDRLRKIADDLNGIDNEYRLCSLEEAEAFAEKRNYTYG
jgi:hypothetical protein